MSNITTTNETTPSTPTSGKSKIYIESTSKKIESVDDAGVVSKYVTEANDKVMVSSNDTTPGYLEDKIVVPATSGLAKSTLNDASDEDVQIALDVNGTTDKITPVVADEILIGDTEDSNAIKKADIASIVILADHDTITNNHNLTTDIDHDQLTNFTATEHFTMLDEDNMASDSDTQAATQQSIKAYVDALGSNPAKTYTISPSGGDYTTIQAALTANATGGELFIVYPGTYTNDTINFTANAQTVMTPSKGNNVIVTNSAQVVEAGNFTECKIKNIRINFTPTTAINAIEVNDGSLSLDSARLDLTTSSAIAGSTQPALLAVTGIGALTTKFGEFTYQHTGNTTNGIKAMFNVPIGGTIDCLRPCESSMTNSGTAAATSLAIDAGSGVIRITNACNFIITDTAASVVAGLGYIGGSGSDEFEYCKIKIVGGGSNTCYGIYNGGTGSIRSMHNIIEVVSGAANYGFFTGVNATTTTIADDVRAADKNSGTGIFIQASSNADGEFSLYKESDPNLVLGNVTKEDIEGGRESSIVFKGKQSGGEETTLAKIVAQHDGTSDDQKGDFIIQTNDGTDGDAPTERLRIDSAGLLSLAGAASLDGAVTVNESGADVDFRVESDVNTHSLFIDGATGIAGFGVVPEAWSTVYAGVQFGGIGSITAEATPAASNQLQIANNLYNDGSWKHIIEDEASVYSQFNGAHILYTCPLASADAAATFVQNMKLTATENVFNEGSADIDFRVESDNDTHALFVQGSDGRIGLGTANPQDALHLYSTSNTFSRFESSLYSAGFTFVSGGTTKGILIYDYVNDCINLSHSESGIAGLSQINIKEGKLSTGGETAPDVDPGGLCLKTTSAGGNVITIKGSIAHGLTSVAETDTGGIIREAGSGTGGFRMVGITDGDESVPVVYQFIGYGRKTAQTTTATTSRALMEFTNYQHNGSNSSSAPASTANMVSIRNGGSARVLFKGNGNVEADGTVTSNSFDFAEYFESISGESIPNGTPVVLEVDKIRPALQDENPIGVISATACFIGNQGLGWQKRYLRDNFGAELMQDIQWVTWEEEELVSEAVEGVEEVEAKEAVYKMVGRQWKVSDLPEDIIIPENAEYYTTKDRVLNPDYDPEAEFIPRKDRPEWNIVGLLGQVYIRKGSPINPNWIFLKEANEEADLYLIK